MRAAGCGGGVEAAGGEQFPVARGEVLPVFGGVKGSLRWRVEGGGEAPGDEASADGAAE